MASLLNRKRSRIRLAGLVVATLAAVMAACGTGETGKGASPSPTMEKQMGAGMGDVPRVPPVFGYYNGESIFFVHTEVSDQKIAQVLERMMRSPVPTVPSLATVPNEALGTVYVFTNGVKPQDTPAGPLGFQPDIFDSAPGDPNYTPLRRIVNVTWNDQAQARVLKSVQEIEQAKAARQISLQPTGVVVTAPLLTWPGGQR